MPTRSRRFVAPLVAALMLAGCAGRGGAPPPAITMTRLHAEVDRHVCALWSPEVSEWGGPLYDDRCPWPEVDSELAAAARAAVTRIRPVGMLARVSERSFDTAVRGQPGSAQSLVDQRAREAFWRDPQLSRAITLALQLELRTRQWRCEDCPEVSAPPDRTVAWAMFRPYLGAYIHPQAGEAGKVDVYVCAGNNGAAALPPDPGLLQAGVMTAFHFAMDETMGAQFHDISRAARSVDEAATALDALLESPEGRSKACTAVADSAWFTGLHLAECPPTPPDRSA